MLSIRQIIITTLSLVPIISGHAEATDLVQAARDQFVALLEALPSESIHAALHQNLEPKFQDGIYEHDKSAVEALHNEDPPLATRVLAVAALEVIKRQNSATNATSAPLTSIPTVSTVIVPPTTSKPSSTAIVIPVTVSSTNSVGSVVTTTSSAIATPTVSVVVPVSTTNSQGSTVVTSSTAPAVVVTSSGITSTSIASIFRPSTVPTTPIDITTTDSSGESITFRSLTSGGVATATDRRGSVFVTTYTPGYGSVVNSLVLQTTTLPNGERSTITSFAYVAPAAATSPSGNQPHLQNAAVSMSQPTAIAIFGVIASLLLGGTLLI